MNRSSIRIEGNIVSQEILDKIASGDAHGQAPKDFGFDHSAKVKDQIAKAWADAKSLYQIFKHRIEDVPEKESGISETRRFWMLLFFELLGYHLDRSEAETVAGNSYAISHRAGNLDGFPVLIMGFRQSLDRKPPTGLRMSPHATLQEYLNLTEHIYGIVTNGIHLRLLRDSSRLTKLSFLEFDLVQMMEEDLYADFALLFRTLHASRMPKEQNSGDTSLIEAYHQDALDAGSSIRSRLSRAVEQSILRLANSFLKESSNEALREWAGNHPQAAGAYYDWLLKLIYRLLFLMVIEERDLVFADREQRKKRIYYDHYSLHRLRRLSEKLFLASERHYDLWDSLRLTFRLFQPEGDGSPLGIAPLAGSLFGAGAIGLLAQCRLHNRALLDCIHRLSQFDNEQGQRIRVNYASLDVEEFGSVYESLLEYEPVIDRERLSFTFAKGTGRGETGSHYTPDELVQPLIKHSLDYLIEDRLKEKDREGALLSLKVADVACGSGHILLAAGRRIGLALARVRTGEDQPSPSAIRQATRDVIQHCIYGVDKNPLAVELCKVALWLESHNPGQPLSFLDHRIKCGDSIVGLAHKKELERGIPDEAFKALPGDDKTVAALLRKANRQERESREKGQLRTSAMLDVDTDLANLRRLFAEFDVLPENTPEQVEAKARAYQKLTSGDNWQRLKQLADLQVAQFFLPKVEASDLVTDGEYFEFLEGRKSLRSPKVERAVSAAREKRFFHWFLEFPEVFDRGGFDCVLGNPPFLGGQKISGTFGLLYPEWLKFNFAPIGSVDLVTYFFRRIFYILRKGGFQSLISTNTIAQGGAREGGLAVILDQGGAINHAVRSMRWPGQAAVEVALLTIHKGSWHGKHVLDRREVRQITSYLDDAEALGDPYRLAANANKSFQGSIALGKGYVLEPEEAQSLISKNPKNKEVLFPFLNGDDINKRPDQSPSRWAINFFDWEEDFCRKNYPNCFEILEQLVKPQRMLDNRASYRIFWWQYAEKRSNLYRAISPLSRVMVVALTSNTVAFCFMPNNIIFSHATIVLALVNYAYFSILQSSIHRFWVDVYSSKMKTDQRYTPTNCFETYPFSSEIIDNGNLDFIGETYHEFRRHLMLDTQLGLTKTYNQFHNAGLREIEGEGMSPRDVEQRYGKETAHLWKHLSQTPRTIPYNEAVARIVRLRELHREMDEAVLAAYGWHEASEKWGPAIRLRHDFYEVDYLPENDRVRYTIHPEARKEVLKRLLLLNHELYEEEVRQGLHGKGKRGAVAAEERKPVRGRQGKLWDDGVGEQGELF